MLNSNPSRILLYVDIGEPIMIASVTRNILYFDFHSPILECQAHYSIFQEVTVSHSNYQSHTTTLHRVIHCTPYHLQLTLHKCISFSLKLQYEMTLSKQCPQDKESAKSVQQVVTVHRVKILRSALLVDTVLLELVGVVFT